MKSLPVVLSGQQSIQLQQILGRDALQIIWNALHVAAVQFATDSATAKRSDLGHESSERLSAAFLQQANEANAVADVIEQAL